MKKLLTFTLLVLFALPMRAADPPLYADNLEVSFGFRSREAQFYMDLNESEINRLFAFIDKYYTEIRSGKVKVYVSAYSADYELPGQNLNISRERASQVKSFMMIKKGLRERDFITSTFAARKGERPSVTVRISAPTTNKDMVGTTTRPVEPKPVPQNSDFGTTQSRPQPELVVMPVETKPAHRPAGDDYIPDSPKPVVKEVVAEKVTPVVTPRRPKLWTEPYVISLRTNFLYYAMLTPNLGLEIRPARGFGIKLAGGYSDWTWENSKKNQLMSAVLLNAELRWYMGPRKRFYLGLGANAADFDIRWNLFNTVAGSADKGYDGRLYNGGLVMGYQARLSNALSMDFNLGFGYNHIDLKEYEIDNNGNPTSVCNNKNIKAWVPTQAEIALVWRMGRKRKP